VSDAVMLVGAWRLPVYLHLILARGFATYFACCAAFSLSFPALFLFEEARCHVVGSMKEVCVSAPCERCAMLENANRRSDSKSRHCRTGPVSYPQLIAFHERSQRNHEPIVSCPSHLQE
jgi:hypothetical protein